MGNKQISRKAYCQLGDYVYLVKEIQDNGGLREVSLYGNEKQEFFMNNLVKEVQNCKEVVRKFQMHEITEEEACHQISMIEQNIRKNMDTMLNKGT